ncbi:MAG: DUF2325 domain-containing protein [Burkholderiales bacterium]|nr:DUF2325 domain-containing protein [Burkholderiales bacterium]
MCDRCEPKGLLAGLFAKAGVAPASSALVTSMVESEPESRKQPAPRRPKLWELEEKHHCPVIGSCLTLDELKKIARKCGFNGNFGGECFDPYRLHVEAVSLSCSRNDAAEAMHKLLERKYAIVIARFERVKSDADVLALWKQHLKRGEVADAMWAALTHKAASRDTRNQVYGDVHMFSHQIGAGQAADLRRLEWLQREQTDLGAENARLAEELRQQSLQTDSAKRDLARANEQVAHLEPLLNRVRELESGQAMSAIGRRLLLAEAQASRVREAEARIETLEEKVAILRGDKARLVREMEKTAAERDALERFWLEEASSRAPSATTCSGECDTCITRRQGRCVICVIGGRTPLLPHYRQLAERLGVRLIHHDGGKEESLSRLPDLLSAADAVICPTDYVSHNAYYQLKRHCKRTGKPCVLFKGASISGFAVALARLSSGRVSLSGEPIEPLRPMAEK